MKKSLIFGFTLVILALSSGCSSTWEGVKEDTGKAVENTKEAIHDATR